jgi:hypothetical protein
MVKHVKEMIHRVGSYDKFRKIVYKAVTTESSGNALKKLKTMHGAEDVRSSDQITAAAQMAAPNPQTDSIVAL